MMVTLFIVMHNLSMNLVQYLVPFIQKLSYIPKATQNMQMREDKCYKILFNVLFKKAMTEIAINFKCFSIFNYG